MDNIGISRLFNAHRKTFVSRMAEPGAAAAIFCQKLTQRGAIETIISELVCLRRPVKTIFGKATANGSGLLYGFSAVRFTHRWLWTGCRNGESR
ncbi:hypothetical protein EA797_20595 [Stutzerimonas zhaodongensis]|uniref:Uncharacterized protein n=1 Tax=Stutzerimonas zhaodongensis TaxID=1176257 RepID=A0A3M2HPI6_9GAMM|nr:hypothetical protein EA797_20595 [Stutzerimonas zhaodongensis]